MPVFQRGEKGYYVLWNNFVYFLDGESQSLMPLCSKADCLHDQETDSERLVGCHAYVGENLGGSDVGINYCNGWIYTIVEDFDNATLIRIAEDGTKKETVYQWSGTHSVEQWAVHRNVLYYVEHSYYMENNAVREKYALMQLSLEDGLRQPKELYEPPQEYVIYSMSWPQVYGNYIYIQVDGSTTSEEEITDDNYLQYLYFRTIACNLETGETSELTAPDMGDHDYIQGVTFWQDHILIKPATAGQVWEKTGTVYSANLDGSDPQVFIEDIPQGDQLLSDGKYLYLTNHNRVTRWGEGEAFYQVLDKDLNEVDTFTMPYGWDCYIAVGDPDERFDLYYETDGADEESEEFDDMEDEEITGWGVFRWDKTTIGSYHGEPFAYTEIPYHP